MTGGCIDRLYGDMLHHYELGLLSEDERRAFEHHLYDCAHCLEEVEEFRSVAGLLQGDQDVQQTIRQVIAERDAGRTPAIPEKTVRHAAAGRWPRLIPIFVATAAAMLLLILKPWQIEIRPTEEAVARENRLAIFDFDHPVDDSAAAWFSKMAASLLITDLSESHFLQTISRQRLLDAGEYLARGAADDRGAGGNLGLEIARTVDARWMVRGSIIQEASQVFLAIRVLDVNTGRQLAERRLAMDSTQGIFALVDQLTPQIKKDLTLPQAALDESDPPVANLTTSSPEAYLAYLEGVDAYNKFYWADAVASFQRALEFDSTMAMAYYYMSKLMDRCISDLAMQYLDNVGRLERYYIRSQHAANRNDIDQAISILAEALERFPDEKDAHFMLGQYYFTLREWKQAAVHYEQAVTLDPLYKIAHNGLAYVYDQMGEYELAIAAINKYISIAPDEANPYDTRAEIFAKNDRPDLAIESYRRALQIKPDFYTSRQNLGHLYCLTRQYDLAREQYSILANDDTPRMRSLGRRFLAFITINQGRFAQALEELDRSIAADYAEQDTSVLVNLACKHFLKGTILTQLQQYDPAIKEIRRNQELYIQAFPQAVIKQRNYFVQFLAKSGDTTAAQEMAEGLRQDLEAGNYEKSSYWYAAGCIALAKEKPREAIDAFSKSAEMSDEFPTHFLLAIAYFKTGETAKAVRKFEDLLTKYTFSRTYWGIWNTLLHYYLGQAYEESRWFDKAVEQYELFLEAWRDADTEQPEIQDCKSRLARLRDHG